MQLAGQKCSSFASRHVANPDQQQFELFMRYLASHKQKQMQQIIVRPAEMRDLRTLLTFEQELIASERPFDETLRAERFHYYDLQAMIEKEDAHVVVAETGDTLVASGHARILHAKPYNTFERYAFLGFMYTVPEFRGQGINQTIVAALVEWAKSKNLQEVRLQVYEENIAAIKAYQRSGFVKKLVEMRIEIF